MKRQRAFDFVRPDLALAAAAQITSHIERGCGQYGGSSAYVGGRLVHTPCPCMCIDHDCGEGEIDPVVCQTCGDRGMVKRPSKRYDDPGFGRALPCPTCTAPDARQTFTYARSLIGFPPELIEAFTFERLTDDSVTRIGAERWLGNPKRSWAITFAGPPGTGKTHAALALARSFLNAGRYVYVTTEPDLLDELRASFDRRTEKTAEEILRLPLAVDVLVLDDIGKARQTDYAVEQTYKVIDRRYKERRTTILTTEVLPEDAPRTALWSRVFGDALADVITTDGEPDYRKRGIG